jgi:hypothetical protein
VRQLVRQCLAGGRQSPASLAAEWLEENDNSANVDRQILLRNQAPPQRRARRLGLQTPGDPLICLVPISALLREEAIHRRGDVRAELCDVAAVVVIPARKIVVPGALPKFVVSRLQQFELLGEISRSTVPGCSHATCAPMVRESAWIAAFRPKPSLWVTVLGDPVTHVERPKRRWCA